MQIRYVSPRHQLEDTKPETYFWLECNPDEALAFLAERQVPKWAFLRYLDRIEQVRKWQVDGQYFTGYPEQQDQNYVGFLVSKDGTSIDWSIAEIMFGGFDLTKDFVPRIVLKHPLLPVITNFNGIPNRVDLAKLAGIGVERYASQIPVTEELGLEASDDELAMAIFVYSDCWDGTHPNFNRKGAPDSLAHELGRQFEARGKLVWQNHDPEYPFDFMFFQASEVPLTEIYLRRLRAEHNYEQLLLPLSDEQGDSHRRIHGLLGELDDDQLCEIFLYNWYVLGYDDHTKDIYSIVANRTRAFSNVDEDEDEDEDESFEEVVTNKSGQVPETRDLSASSSDVIVANPFLGPQWVPLAKAIKFVLEDGKNRNSCIMNTYAHAFGLSPNSSPYMQARWSMDTDLFLEISGNRMVEPPLTLRQVTSLEFMGWKVPDDENPNFERVWNDPNLTEVAEFVLTSLVSIYGLEERDFFAFGLTDIPDRVEELGLLDRLKATPENQWRAIFALKDAHPEML